MLPPYGSSFDGAGLKYTDPYSGEIKDNLANPGAHGFTETIYEFSSATSGNGSGCAAMVTSHVAFAAAHGILVIIWWGGSPYSLDARPAEQKTWKQLALTA